LNSRNHATATFKIERMYGVRVTEIHESDPRPPAEDVVFRAHIEDAQGVDAMPFYIALQAQAILTYGVGVNCQSTIEALSVAVSGQQFKAHNPEDIVGTFGYFRAVCTQRMFASMASGIPLNALTPAPNPGGSMLLAGLDGLLAELQREPHYHETPENDNRYFPYYFLF